MMTLQELFDTVVGNLRKQGSKALLTEEQCKELGSPPGTCAYRSQDGKSCAAGGLLTDKEYLPAVEGKGLLFLVGLIPTFRERVGDTADPSFALLRQLQIIHDTASVRDWELEFQQVAQLKDLIYTPPAAP
jgi:hypothetical protein